MGGSASALGNRSGAKWHVRSGAFRGAECHGSLGERHAAPGGQGAECHGRRGAAGEGGGGMPREKRSGGMEGQGCRGRREAPGKGEDTFKGQRGESAK